MWRSNVSYSFFLVYVYLTCYNWYGEVYEKRVISAIVALIIVVPLLILGGYWFYIGACVIGVIGFNEFLLVREKEKVTINSKVFINGCFYNFDDVIYI